tara:strand:- start:2581 stop:2853 length:273 start_codon:yes stop_codon:yes gene_type:complete
MNTAISRSQHATNWMTVVLLTLFVAAFGLYANHRVDTQASNCADPREEVSHVASLPAICEELKSSQWLGRLHAKLTEKACQAATPNGKTG